MNGQPERPASTPNHSRRVLIYLGVASACALVVFVVYGGILHWYGATKQDPVREAAAAEAEVRELCAHCHRFPPPSSFPRSAWRREVEQGFAFARLAGMEDLLEVESVVDYYEARAPEKLDLPPANNSEGPLPVHFKREGYNIPRNTGAPAVSNVNLVHLSDDHKLDLLVCDMRGGSVSVVRPGEKNAKPRVLGRVAHPAHAEVVDLDGDGNKDILVADLGSFYPTNDLVGKVVLLKSDGRGHFTPITLLEHVGRVADVQAADFNGDGKLDLVVAVFGWRTTGEIIYLENQTTDWANPKFVPHVLDKRHGAIHVPVIDLNKDGKMDFVALISQEHETIVAFINLGNGEFRKETIYTGPHPAYGSSGIQLVDLNGDGRTDVLYTNGDVMDSGLLKPYHSIQWLENRGTYPFVHHHITSMCGVHRAVAADFDGKGLMDIVAVSCLPTELYGQIPQQLGLDSAILLKQKSPGEFVRYSLEKGSFNHLTCVLGDLTNSGRIDLVTGNFSFAAEAKSTADWYSIWWNQGKNGAR